jgi:hypothetical protein
MVALRRLVRRARSPEECREEVAVPAGSNAYNSLWQVRTDAWSAFARFHPVYRPRTAMRAARTLAETLRQPDHKASHDAQTEEIGLVDEADHDALLHRERDVRRAFYLAYNDNYCEYLMPDEIAATTRPAPPPDPAGPGPASTSPDVP